MLPTLSSYFQSNAINALEGRYGERLQAMPRRDILAILQALAECAYVVNDGSESDYLDNVVDYNGHQFEEVEVFDLLRQLDGEITDVNQALRLIEGLASIAACRPVTAAA